MTLTLLVYPITLYIFIYNFVVFSNANTSCVSVMLIRLLKIILTLTDSQALKIKEGVTVVQASKMNEMKEAKVPLELFILNIKYASEISQRCL